MAQKVALSKKKDKILFVDLMSRNIYILKMEKFRFGNSGSAVELNKDTVKKMKEELGFYPQSQFYLRLPDKNYLPIILLCLIAKSNKLTTKLSKLIDSIDPGYKKTLIEQHLQPNSRREGFNAPIQLQRLSKTLDYHGKMFADCHQKFEQKSVEYPCTCLKKEEKLIFRYFGSRSTEFGESIKFKDSLQAILLLEEDDRKSLIIATFKGRKLGEDERLVLIEQEEQAMKMPLNNNEEVQDEPPMPDDDGDDEDQVESKEEKKENLIFGVFLVIILICLLSLLNRNSSVSTSLDRWLIDYFPRSTFFIDLWASISRF